MKLSEYFDPRKSIKLIGHYNEFNLLKNLIDNDKIPKVIMLTGDKGIGKATFITHILHYYFDKNNYNLTNNMIVKKANFKDLFLNNLYPNIIYLNNGASENIGIDDVRDLKKRLTKTSMNNEKRFIILDSIETLNISTLNGLLKTIEEPSDKNFFILINNKSKPVLETIKSRSLEIHMNLNEDERIKTINYLLELFDQDLNFKKDLLKVSPGNFIKFNYILKEKKLVLEEKLLKNIGLILNLYKKEKETFYRDFLLFFIDYFLQISFISNAINKDELIKNRSFFTKKINEFFLYNLNQSTLLNSLERSF